LFGPSYTLLAKQLSISIRRHCHKRSAKMAEKEAAVSLSTSSIVDAVFPYDAPSSDEEFFLSVSCGEDTMTWASHEGENFEASCVWK
jgi:hypothetical protein